MGGRPFSMVASTTNRLWLASKVMLMFFSQLTINKQNKMIIKYLIKNKQSNGGRVQKKAPHLRGAKLVFNLNMLSAHCCNGLFEGV